MKRQYVYLIVAENPIDNDADDTMILCAYDNLKEARKKKKELEDAAERSGRALWTMLYDSLTIKKVFVRSFCR